MTDKASLQPRSILHIVSCCRICYKNTNKKYKQGEQMRGHSTAQSIMLINNLYYLHYYANSHNLIDYTKAQGVIVCQD
jgi:hypothetical protein